MLIRPASFLILFFLFASLHASELRVRVFYSTGANIYIVSIPGNDHLYQYDGSEEYPLKSDDMLLLVSKGDSIAVFDRAGKGFVAAELVIRSTQADAWLGLRRGGDPLSEENEYEGDLSFNSYYGKLRVINLISEEKYLAGVVQAEAGYKGTIDYFKTQAVIARTYAMANNNRHPDEDYDLCDDVHCQVYHGRSVTPLIDLAVKETNGLIVADTDSLPVLTPFHSNCGGQTASSGDVWLERNEHLEPVIDPYCSYSGNAQWQQKVSREKWIEYLEKELDTVLQSQTDLNFSPRGRENNYMYEGMLIPLTKIRNDWNLRSTIFSIEDNGGDELLFKGRGYGHGVGLCQEGARVMARRGFNYLRILNYYFNSIIIIDKSFLKHIETVERAY